MLDASTGFSVVFHQSGNCHHTDNTGKPIFGNHPFFFSKDPK
jgi:hypothetical protein